MQGKVKANRAHPKFEYTGKTILQICSPLLLDLQCIHMYEKYFCNFFKNEIQFKSIYFNLLQYLRKVNYIYMYNLQYQMKLILFLLTSISFKNLFKNAD